jgi:hypothetical protein
VRLAYVYYVLENEIGEVEVTRIEDRSFGPPVLYMVSTTADLLDNLNRFLAHLKRILRQEKSLSIRGAALRSFHIT